MDVSYTSEVKIQAFFGLSQYFYQNLQKPNCGRIVGNMKTQLHEFVLFRLQEVKGTWPSVARGCGVPLRTLEKIGRREYPTPGVAHCQAIANYLGWNSPSIVKRVDAALKARMV